jgi:two-component system nitrate/nitrite response regulator NarL
MKSDVGASPAGELRVLVYHRDTMFVDALQSVLELEGFRFVRVGNVEELLAESCRVDCCLIDVRQGDTIEVLHKLTWRPLRLVAFVDTADLRQISAVIDAGAAAWVTTGDGFDRLVHVLRSERAWNDKDKVAVERVARRARAEQGPDLLTAREKDVLSGLMQGETTKEIAARLNVTSATARTHVQNLLAKLGVHTRLQAVAIAFHRNLIGDADGVGGQAIGA